MVGTPLDKIFRNLAIERTNNMSNYDWLWNEYRRVAAKSAVEQGHENEAGGAVASQTQTGDLGEISCLCLMQ
jgi:hypothetical protein